MSSERGFFTAMEEYGFFSHIYERLPSEFTAVFEIARVLEDELSPLHQKLEAALRLSSPISFERKEKVEDFHRYVPSGDEYEADLMQSHRDVSRIYPWQFALPEEIFDQRLAERTLWMPIAKAPKILPVEDIKEGFSLDSTKQKVYVLFDTSSSMTQHHRIHLAKAILFYFLKRNKSELGFISVRTFDDHVGDLHTAIDQASYDSIMRYVLRLTHLGNGTVLQRALLQALDDIQAHEHYAGAEILIITDGAVAIDKDLILSKMDETIRIHTIKIGHAQVYASQTQIDEWLSNPKVHGDYFLAELQRQEGELRQTLKYTEAPSKHHQLELTLQQIRNYKSKLAEKFVQHYGHELKELSSVYIEIDDFNETDIFRADESTISDLEALTDQLETDCEEFLTAELTKRVAILHDHLNFLLKYETDPELRQRISAMNERLRKLLEEAVGNNHEHAEVSGAPQSHILLPMTDEDIRDLKFLIDGGEAGNESSWNLFLRWLWNKALRKVRDWTSKKPS